MKSMINDGLKVKSFLDSEFLRNFVPNNERVNQLSIIETDEIMKIMNAESDIICFMILTENS